MRRLLCKSITLMTTGFIRFTCPANVTSLTDDGGSSRSGGKWTFRRMGGGIQKGKKTGERRCEVSRSSGVEGVRRGQVEASVGRFRCARQWSKTLVSGGARSVSRRQPVVNINRPNLQPRRSPRQRFALYIVAASWRRSSAEGMLSLFGHLACARALHTCTILAASICSLLETWRQLSLFFRPFIQRSEGYSPPLQYFIRLHSLSQNSFMLTSKITLRVHCAKKCIVDLRSAYTFSSPWVQARFTANNRRMRKVDC